MDNLDDLYKRFGDKGFRELARFDIEYTSQLNKLYMITTIAANMHKFNPKLARDFYNNNVQLINILVSNLEKSVDEFQRVNGEI